MPRSSSGNARLKSEHCRDRPCQVAVQPGVVHSVGKRLSLPRPICAAGRRRQLHRRRLSNSSQVVTRFSLLAPQRCEAPQRGTELWWHYFMNQVFFFLSFCNYTTFLLRLCALFSYSFLGNFVLQSANFFCCCRLLSCFKIVDRSHDWIQILLLI